MNQKECDIYVLVETCMDWNRSDLVAEIKSKTTVKFVNNHLVFSNNNFPALSAFQPGGTIQTSNKHWAGRFEKAIYDTRNMGRWVGQQFRLKDSKKLIVVTAYRPCPGGGQEHNISRATYNQQQIMLRNQGFPNPNPRKVLIEDLITLITKYEQDVNNYIVLMMDANESLSDKEGQLSRLLRQTSLVDSFTMHLGIECNIATYDRGKRRLDYIFTSPNLLPHIEKVGYLSFNEDDILSDHRGLFIDFDNNLIENHVEFTRPARRYIGSSSKSIAIFNYKKYVNKQFLTHNIYERATRFKVLSLSPLQNKNEIAYLLNALDTQVTEIVLGAEKEASSHMSTCEWSIEMHHSLIIYRIWQKIIRAKTKGCNTTQFIAHHIQQLQEAVASDITNKVDSACAKTELKLVRKYKKELVKHASRLQAEGLNILADLRKEEGNILKAKSINIIRCKESSKKNWKILGATFGKETKSSLS